LSGVDPFWAAKLAHAVSEAVTFAATVPMPSSGATVRIARGGLTFVLVPVLMQSSHASPSAMEGAISGGVIGAALGLGAVIALSAASAAGAMAGAALQWSPLPERDTVTGPVGFLYQLGFATVFLGSGGFEAVVLALARADQALPGALFTLRGIAGLISVATRDCLFLAAPALGAQALATVVAGLFARAAPQVGGLFLTSPLVSAAVGMALLVAGGSLIGRFGWAVTDAVARLTLH
jgi:type III secretory pathway component EscT